MFIINFVCDLCDADYTNQAAWKLFKCVAELKKIGNWQLHGRNDLLNYSKGISTFWESTKAINLIVFEMLYTKKFKPNLNVQMDSTRAKLFCLAYNFLKSYFHHLMFVSVFIQPDLSQNFKKWSVVISYSQIFFKSHLFHKKKYWKTKKSGSFRDCEQASN